MKIENLKEDDFTNRLKKGLRLSFQKLVKDKQNNNASLFFSKHGKIIKVKAKDIKV